MIDTLQKLPDSFIGMMLAASIWFGLNYAILAERAMDRTVRRDIVPGCINDLITSENKPALLQIPSNILPDSPEMNLRGLFRQFQNRFRLSPAQRLALCRCAGKRTMRAVKFDYAIHTASLRLVTPDSVQRMRGKTLSIINFQTCGVLPWSNLR